jgi:hypothetical protein
VADEQHAPPSSLPHMKLHNHAQLALTALHSLQHGEAQSTIRSVESSIVDCQDQGVVAEEGVNQVDLRGNTLDADKLVMKVN